jgi:DNA-binding LacI/PurR family transcriptional regulator
MRHPFLYHRGSSMQRKRQRVSEASATQPVTMKQIGRLAGVSQSTVSRILNGVEGSVRIPPETRERVFQAVRDLGYRPNPLARGLRGAGTAMIGLVVREVYDPFFSSVIGAIGVEARRHNHNVVMGYAESRTEDAAEITWVLEARHCDGILLLGDLRDHPWLSTELASHGRPMLALCVGTRSADVPIINTDNAAGADLALDHLWELGHRRIAFLDAGWLGDVRERRDRTEAFLRERGAPAPAGYMRLADNQPHGGYDAARAVLALPDPPTAIFASTDLLAIGALKAAADAGRRVPGSLSVIGFDDIPLGGFVTPGLTTVRQPVADMAAIAVADLLAMVADPAFEPEPLRRLPPTLVIRESTGPAPR